jgi:hypothetical protein
LADSAYTLAYLESGGSPCFLPDERSKLAVRLIQSGLRSTPFVLCADAIYFRNGVVGSPEIIPRSWHKSTFTDRRFAHTEAPILWLLNYVFN